MKRIRHCREYPKKDRGSYFRRATASIPIDRETRTAASGNGDCSVVGTAVGAAVVDTVVGARVAAASDTYISTVSPEPGYWVIAWVEGV